MAYAYVYNAALWCLDCGRELRQSLPVPIGAELDNESTWDSDDYPKGPYPNGGGEADCAQHCDGCGVALGNPVIVPHETVKRRLVLRCDKPEGVSI